MVATLDSVLNILIPAAIFIAIIVFIYFKAKKPIDNFFSSIKDKLSREGKDASDSKANTDYVKSGDYKIEYKGSNY